jgi:hypothetical protein
MDSDLEHTLYSQFPKIFANRHNDPYDILNDRWLGLEIDNGWYVLLYSLCYKIQNYIDYDYNGSIEQVKFTQVKEKFGDLRIYYVGGDRFVEGLVSMTEAISHKTCEKCGVPGKLRTERYWLKVLCDEHNTQ